MNEKLDKIGQNWKQYRHRWTKLGLTPMLMERVGIKLSTDKIEPIQSDGQNDF